MQWLQVSQIVDGRTLPNIVNVEAIIRVIDQGGHSTIVTSDGNSIDVTDSADSIKESIRATIK